MKSGSKRGTAQNSIVIIMSGCNLRRKHRKSGFTLAELLIVVAIIAVLTAIAVPVFTTQLERSREATDLSNIRAAASDLYSDFLVNGAIEMPDIGDPANPNLANLHWIQLPDGNSYGSRYAYVTIVGAKQTMPGWQGTNGEVNLRVDGQERTCEFDAATAPGYYVIEITNDGIIDIRALT